MVCQLIILKFINHSTVLQSRIVLYSRYAALVQILINRPWFLPAMSPSRQYPRRKLQITQVGN